MDGRVVPASEATVPLADDGFLRGDAIFEGIYVRRGRTHQLDAHLARMRMSASTMDIRLPVLRQVVTDLLAAWGDRDGAMRLIVTRSGTIRGLIESPVWPQTMSLAVLDIPWRTALTGAKTLSYAANQWAVRQAAALAANDALIVNNGVVLELPTGALVVVEGGQLRTPDPQQVPILDSVTVKALQEIADVHRDVITVEELLHADEAFIVSATRPIIAVNALVIDDEVTRFDAPGPHTAALKAQFDEHIDATLDPLT